MVHMAGGPMKVLLQYATEDPGVAASESSSARLLEGFELKTAEQLLDGPVSPRVAIIDLNPDTGLLEPGAVFEPPSGRRKRGRYLVRDPNNGAAADFRQVSVFSAIMKAIQIFEDEDVLGRKISWAFDGGQLLVVPRAGRMVNAFYHRPSRSLQFFFFDAEINGRQIEVQTCLSPDIVVHEVSHAILDGVAPDLYDAVSPQALALHEAVADMTAVIFALRTQDLALRTLEKTKGNLRQRSAFSGIAEQFGRATSGGAHEYLRSVFNEFSLDSTRGKPLPSGTPHDLSTVLTGALYNLLLAAYEREKAEVAIAPNLAAAEREDTLFSASGLALFVARQITKRMAFRALDYLPPGEVSFADYGRAMIAADCAANPGDPWARDFLCAEFVRRGIVADASEMLLKPPALDIPADLDLAALLADNAVATNFVERSRDALLIPRGIAIEIRPRLDVTKSTRRSNGGSGAAQRATFRELMLKVAWRETQVLKRSRSFVEAVEMGRGTTLVIDVARRKATALLSTSPLAPEQSHRSALRNLEMREDHLHKCLDDELIEPGTPQAPLNGTHLRVTGLAQFLHLCEH